MKRLLLTAALCTAAITAHAQTRDPNNPDPNKGEMFHYASVIWIDPSMGLGCEATVQGNRSGIELRFGIDLVAGTVEGPAFMQVEHPIWTSIVDGQEYRHTVQIDRYAPQEIIGIGLHNKAGVPAMRFRNLGRHFIDAFRQGTWIRLWHDGKSVLDLSLQDSAAALHLVADCQTEVARYDTRHSAPTSKSPY